MRGGVKNINKSELNSMNVHLLCRKRARTSTHVIAQLNLFHCQESLLWRPARVAASRWLHDNLNKKEKKEKEYGWEGWCVYEEKNEYVWKRRKWSKYLNHNFLAYLVLFCPLSRQSFLTFPWNLIRCCLDAFLLHRQLLLLEAVSKAIKIRVMKSWISYTHFMLKESRICFVGNWMERERERPVLPVLDSFATSMHFIGSSFSSKSKGRTSGRPNLENIGC